MRLTFTQPSFAARAQSTPQRWPLSQPVTAQQTPDLPPAPRHPPRTLPLATPKQARQRLLKLHDAQQAGHDVRNDTLRALSALEGHGAPAAAAGLVGEWDLMPNTAPTLFGKRSLRSLCSSSGTEAQAEVHTIRLSVSETGRVRRSAHFRTDEGREGVMSQYGRMTSEGGQQVRLTWKGTTLRLGEDPVLRAANGKLPALPHEVPYVDAEVFLLRRYNGFGPQSVLGWKRV